MRGLGKLSFDEIRAVRDTIPVAELAAHLDRLVMDLKLKAGDAFIDVLETYLNRVGSPRKFEIDRPAVEFRTSDGPGTVDDVRCPIMVWEPEPMEHGRGRIGHDDNFSFFFILYIDDRTMDAAIDFGPTPPEDYYEKGLTFLTLPRVVDMFSIYADFHRKKEE